jgi:hypothetical protein
VDGAFALDNGALGVGLVFLGVAFDHVQALDDSAVLFAGDSEDFAALAQGPAGDDDDFVVFFNMEMAHG